MDRSDFNKILIIYYSLLHCVHTASRWATSDQNTQRWGHSLDNLHSNFSNKQKRKRTLETNLQAATDSQPPLHPLNLIILSRELTGSQGKWETRDDHNQSVAKFFPKSIRSSNDLKLTRYDNLERVFIRIKGLNIRVDRRLTGQQTGDHFAIVREIWYKRHQRQNQFMLSLNHERS